MTNEPIENSTFLETLQELEEKGEAQFLESTGQFDRYWTNPHRPDEDGESEWVCTLCGEEVDDPSEGCPNCGETED